MQRYTLFPDSSAMIYQQFDSYIITSDVAACCPVSRRTQRRWKATSHMAWNHTWEEMPLIDHVDTAKRTCESRQYNKSQNDKRLIWCTQQKPKAKKNTIQKKNCTFAKSLAASHSQPQRVHFTLFRLCEPRQLIQKKNVGITAIWGASIGLKHSPVWSDSVEPLYSFFWEV